ncbi:MAG: Gfo/Idh/MocA family oxidoreductase [Planctomycetes bacterium]|nr:Gfo/Idh/MocA family oxidoreductase [Planctomycetota bacterium]
MASARKSKKAKIATKRAKAASRKKTPIRVGVIGVGRGRVFADGAGLAGMKLVALCDSWQERVEEVGKEYSVATYTDYDKFLEHDMDAVMLANYFHEHAPFAIKALKAGKHVMSECSCNATLAEGVALCRAVEKSGKIYMLAENYPYTAFSMEMQRLYRTGEIGEVTYAEGEYNHPMGEKGRLALSPGLNHWRNWTPSTYYCTHALAPLMAITGRTPVKVNALSIAGEKMGSETVKKGDPGSVILCRMDNGAVFRLFGLMLPGHSNWYRVHGSRGAMEITRGPGYFGPGQLRVWHDEWDCPKGKPTERTYVPDWPTHGDLARKSGHSGGDFWTNFCFANAIRSGEQPYLDVYRGVTMSSVGILAWKSALQDGVPFDVPDFSEESSRRKVAKDNWSPFPSHAAAGQPPPSILGTPKVTAAGLAAARKEWAKQGYKGK